MCADIDQQWTSRSRLKRREIEARAECDIIAGNVIDIMMSSGKNSECIKGGMEELMRIKERKELLARL